MFQSHVSNDSLFGEGCVEIPGKESPLACVAEYDCTNETAVGILTGSNDISVCNMQSKGEYSASSQSESSHNVLTNDGQVMAGAVRVPLQKRVVDSVGKIGMMVSLNEPISLVQLSFVYFFNWQVTNYIILPSPPRPISTFQFISIPMIVQKQYARCSSPMCPMIHCLEKVV